MPAPITMPTVIMTASNTDSAGFGAAIGASAACRAVDVDSDGSLIERPSM
jgi:hypothetical protein